jgi:glucan biosynthesis protein C
MTNERYYGLDALRGSMMLLGIVLHAATFHLIEIAAIDAPPSVLILTVLGFIHQFRMPLFFLLSGFFTALLVQKYNIRGAMENRSKRILVPFLLCLATIVPLTDWLFFSTFFSGQQGGFALLQSTAELETIRNEMRLLEQPAHLTLMHLWFLYYLLIYLAAVPALAFGVQKLEQNGALSKLRALVANPWSLLLFATCSALSLIPFASAAVAVNDPLLLPGIGNLGYYGVFFAAGYLLFHTREILQTFRAHTGTYGILAVFTFIWYAIPAWMIGSGSTVVAVLALAKIFSAISTWCFIYFLCGFFLNNFNRDTAATRLLSQSAYWTYLLHMPLVLFIGIVLMTLPVDLGAHLRLLINVLTTAGICYFSYVLLVRSSWLGALLNGRRYAVDGKPLYTPPHSPNKI